MEDKRFATKKRLKKKQNQCKYYPIDHKLIFITYLLNLQYEIRLAFPEKTSTKPLNIQFPEHVLCNWYNIEHKMRRHCGFFAVQSEWLTETFKATQNQKRSRQHWKRICRTLNWYAWQFINHRESHHLTYPSVTHLAAAAAAAKKKRCIEANMYLPWYRVARWTVESHRATETTQAQASSSDNPFSVSK